MRNYYEVINAREKAKAVMDTHIRGSELFEQALVEGWASYAWKFFDDLFTAQAGAKTGRTPVPWLPRLSQEEHEAIRQMVYSDASPQQIIAEMPEWVIENMRQTANFMRNGKSGGESFISKCF